MDELLHRENMDHVHTDGLKEVENEMKNIHEIKCRNMIWLEMVPLKSVPSVWWIRQFSTVNNIE